MKITYKLQKKNELNDDNLLTVPAELKKKKKNDHNSENRKREIVTDHISIGGV